MALHGGAGIVSFYEYAADADNPGSVERNLSKIVFCYIAVGQRWAEGGEISDDIRITLMISDKNHRSFRWNVFFSMNDQLSAEHVHNVFGPDGFRSLDVFPFPLVIPPFFFASSMAALYGLNCFSAL